jgi:UDPglucose 6-dehydrogenase
VIVTKSTVPVGTGRQVGQILRKALPGGAFDVASNPEFLREGSAIQDFMRPDRVVIGTGSEHAREVLGALYRPLYLLETPMVFTAIETAELIKYAANAFLATKITFINEVADLCEAVGADVQTSPAASGSTAASGANSCMPGRALAARAFRRIARRWCAPPRRPARRCRSSIPSSRSTMCASARWPSALPRRAAAASPARRWRCWG